MDQNWWRDNWAAVRKSCLVKIALGILIVIWAVIGNWDLFVSQLVPANLDPEKWRVIDVVERPQASFLGGSG